MFYLAGVSKISIVMRSNNIDRRSYLSSTPAVIYGNFKTFNRYLIILA